MKASTNRGFTLVELMVVIVIIGILASLAIPRFLSATSKARLSEFKPVLKEIFTLQESHYQETNSYAGVGQESALGFTTPGAKPNFNYGLLNGAGAALSLGTASTKSTVSITLSDNTILTGGSLTACISTRGVVSSATTLGATMANQVAKDVAIVDSTGTPITSTCN